MPIKPETQLKRDLVKIEKLKSMKSALSEKINNLEQKTQTKCLHPIDQIVEGEYKSYEYIDSCDPPFRVCKVCGYAEEGWGCGYFKLGKDVRIKIPEIDRDAAWKFVKTFYSNEKLADMRYGV